jgi:hypothetical protein
MGVWRLLVLAVGVLLPMQLRADPPTTSPASPETVALVAQLGDADFKVREQAAWRLNEIGQPALAAIKEAAQSNDPEVRSLAEMLIKRIEGRAISSQGQPSQDLVSITVDGGVLTLHANDNGRQVQIQNRPDGIELTVVGVVDGKSSTKTYKAKTAEQLRAEAPDAYALYERYSRGMTMVRPGEVHIPGIAPGLDPNALWPPPIDPLEELDEQLQVQLRKANIPAKEQWKVLDLLNQARNARDADPAMTEKNRDKQLQDFYTRCDELRKRMEELKLPNPDAFLPPPASARLGVLLKLKPNEMGSNDLVVQRVMAGSRAEQLGLKAGDILVQINDAKVRSLEGLRRTLLQNKPPVVVTVIRENKGVELREK